MGKSTVAEMFARAGVPVFDADAEVRRLQESDREVIEAIEGRFPGTTGPQGVDRDALSSRVLGRPEELHSLEQIVHPAVQRARAEFLSRNAGKPALLFDIPLLFETGGEAAFDKVIVVSTPADVQRARVLARPGMSEAKLDALLARQMPDSEKRRGADFVIDTGGDLSTTQDQVREILACLGLAQGE